MKKYLLWGYFILSISILFAQPKAAKNTLFVPVQAAIQPKLDMNGITTGLRLHHQLTESFTFSPAATFSYLSRYRDGNSFRSLGYGPDDIYDEGFFYRLDIDAGYAQMWKSDFGVLRAFTGASVQKSDYLYSSIDYLAQPIPQLVRNKFNYSEWGGNLGVSGELLLGDKGQIPVSLTAQYHYFAQTKSWVSIGVQSGIRF